jgi:hypothetical protein
VGTYWYGDDNLNRYPVIDTSGNTVADGIRKKTVACLIAAAPELLDELVQLVQLIAAEYPQQRGVWLEGARRAIAKPREPSAHDHPDPARSHRVDPAHR